MTSTVGKIQGHMPKEKEILVGFGHVPCMVDSKGQSNHGFFTEVPLNGKRTGPLSANRLFLQFGLPCLSVFFRGEC